MTLSGLSKLNGAFNVFIWQSSSSYLTMYVQDMLKAQLGCTADTVFEVKSKKDLKELKGLQTITPFMSLKWLAIVDLRSFNRSFKELIEFIKGTTTIAFFCVSERYSDYKSIKDSLKGMDFVYDMYMMSLRKPDFTYLYNAFVPKGALTGRLRDYVYQSYSSDVDAVLDLFRLLKSGEVIENRADIAEVCGVGGNSVESFVFSLVSTPPKTARGISMVLRNKMKAGYELSEVYGWTKLYNRVCSCLQSFIDIKGLRISAIIYKRMVDLPDTFDTKQLMRYQRYIDKLAAMPMSLLMTLQYHLRRRVWRNDFDFAEFMYCYLYERLVVEVVPTLPVVTEDDLAKQMQELEEKNRQAAEKAEKERKKKEALALYQKYGVLKAREILAKRKEGKKTLEEQGKSSLLQALEDADIEVANITELTDVEDDTQSESTSAEASEMSGAGETVGVSFSTVEQNSIPTVEDNSIPTVEDLEKSMVEVPDVSVRIIKRG